MISRRPGSHLMFVALALAATLPAIKPPEAQAASDEPEKKKPERESNSLAAVLERHAKPESSFARERRLKREQRDDFPTHCEIEVAKTYEPRTAFKSYGPPKSQNKRTPPPKHHHRPRGRGR